MRLICPNCDAQYEVPDDAIPEEGRDVQCSNCGHAWFQGELDQDDLDHDSADPVAPGPVAMAAPDLSDHEPDEPAQPVTPAFAPPRRQLDESLVAVLREEAERETKARARAEPPVLEAQGDLGLEAMPSVRVAARRVVPQPELTPELAEPPRAPKGRELLPDIEEINSTLRPVDRSDDPFDMEPAAESPNSGFRSGFAFTLLIAMALLALYVTAPQLAQKIPALADALRSYVAGVDALRLSIDALVTRLLDQAQG